MKPILLILAVLFSAILLAACGSEDGTTSDESTTTLRPMESSETPAPPGLYDLPDGRKQALGVLEYRDLEGGFWAVVRAYAGEPSDDADVVVVLANAEDLDLNLEGLSGSYVRAEGQLLEGASVRMAGPEMEVDELAPVSETSIEKQEEPGSEDDY